MIKTNKFSTVNLLIRTTLLLIVSIVIIGCGRENEQPFIETIADQTVAVNARKMVEIYITDTDEKDMHTVSAYSKNTNIATVSINDRHINSIGVADLSIEGVTAGSTLVTVSATDDSGQDNATDELVFEVISVEPQIIVSTASPLKESSLDNSVITLSLIGLTFDPYLPIGGIDVFGINGVTFNTTLNSNNEVEVVLSYDYTGFVTDGNLEFTVNANAFEEDYFGPSLTAELPVVADLRAESYYDHIVGPWLWMIAPGGNIDVDNLLEASGGVITEQQIAQKGVSEGEHFKTLKWTKGYLHPTTVCGIFLCSSDNVINVVREIGLTNSYQLTQYSAYALINIVSSSDQNDVLMGVGSDDSIKVWLNGSVVYTNNIQRRTTGIQNRFHANLNTGNNLLLIKVCNHGWGGNDDWGMFFKIYLDPQDYNVSIP